MERKVMLLLVALSPAALLATGPAQLRVDAAEVKVTSEMERRLTTVVPQVPSCKDVGRDLELHATGVFDAAPEVKYDLSVTAFASASVSVDDRVVMPNYGFKGTLIVTSGDRARTWTLTPYGVGAQFPRSFFYQERLSLGLPARFTAEGEGPVYAVLVAGFQHKPGTFTLDRLTFIAAREFPASVNSERGWPELLSSPGSTSAVEGELEAPPLGNPPGGARCCYSGYRCTCSLRVCQDSSTCQLGIECINCASCNDCQEFQGCSPC